MLKLTHLLWLSFALLLLGSTPSFAANSTALLAKQRIIFQQAKKALETKQLTQLKSLQSQLIGYPLLPYLDYLYLRHRLSQVDANRINQFLATQQDTFYAKRLRSAWLNRLAQTKQWPLFLASYQSPQSVSKQCLRLQALIATRQAELAFQEILPLWLVPKSQHKACNPAFKVWQDNGLLTDELRLQRIHLALAENQYSLALYLAKQLANPVAANTEIMLWRKVHNKPLASLQSLPSTSHDLGQDTAVSREIILHGIARLAHNSTDQAYDLWQRIAPKYQFSEQDKLFTQRYIGKRAALRREDRTLEYYGDTPAEPWRVRAALWQQDWPAVQQAVLSLNANELQSNRWQYWLGRSQQALGNTAAANATFQGLIMQRDYYSFLAADTLGQPYQMNHHPIVIASHELDIISQLPAVTRLREFHALNMTLEARRQAYEIEQSFSPRELQLVATLTHRWGWHRQTIALLGKAKYWDALDLRFPVVFDKALNTAEKNNIDSSWLFAIARQESAFDPHARSHVGATGLMQLMPATAKLIARLIKQPLKTRSELLNPNRNIQLGSAYLNKMYNENQQNPVLATASYNAGPHRVANWLPSKNMPADIWIENIPYNETRKYTSNVLSYAAIFDFQRKQTILPLAKRMPVVKPKKP